MPATRIILVRHGRSAHVERRWLDVSGLRDWFAAYDAAELIAGERPPEPVRAMARAAGVIAASDMPRARASVALLVGDAPVVVSPLLREIVMPIPALVPVRLPLPAWAVMIGARWVYGARRGELPSPEMRAQVAGASALLANLAEQHGSVLAVTHGTVRGMIAATLRGSGFAHDSWRRGYRHWSAWTLTRAAR